MQIPRGAFALVLAVVALVAFFAARWFFSRSTRLANAPTMGQRVVADVTVIGVNRLADLAVGFTAPERNGGRRGTYAPLSVLFQYSGHWVIDISRGGCSICETDDTPVLVIFDTRSGLWSVAVYDGGGERPLPRLEDLSADHIIAKFEGCFAPNEAMMI